MFEFATDAGKILAVKKGGSGFEIVTGGSDYIRNLTLKATGGDPNNLVTLEITKDGNQVGKITVNKNDVDIDKVKSEIAQQDLEVRVDSGSGGGPGDPPDKPPTGGGGSFDDLPDDIKKAINNKNLTDDIKQQYARILTGEKKDIAEKLIRTQIDNFDPLVDVQKFENVVNALDSTADVVRMQRVFDRSYLNTLGDAMIKRYNKLLDQVKNNDLEAHPVFGNPSFSDRLALLDQVQKIQNAIKKKLPSDVYIDGKLSTREIAYGSYKITIPGKETISENIVALSGKKMPDQINGLSPESTIEVEGTKRRFIPIVPKKDKRFLELDQRGGVQDSERKIFIHILNELEKVTNIKFDPLNSYRHLNLSGQITINTQMTPCRYCANIIKKDMERMFGDKIQIDINYGVIYTDPKK